MYLKLNETKVSVLAETHDSNVLTLYIKPDLEMQDVYNLFKGSSLETIILYNDDDTLQAVLAGYVNIESFFFRPVENQYVMNLSKYKVGDLQEGMEKCMEKCDALAQDVAYIQEGDLTKQSEYALRAVAATFTDDQALNCILLFPAWSGSGVAYKKGDRLRHEGKLYKVLLDHTSQADWVPGSAPSLYVEVSDPAIEYPEWKQPTGAHDAYQNGDKVTYNGKKYISLIDSNTYSPADYPAGWKLVEE